jgi:hypothetical protein
MRGIAHLEREVVALGGLYRKTDAEGHQPFPLERSTALSPAGLAAWRGRTRGAARGAEAPGTGAGEGG